MNAFFRQIEAIHPSLVLPFEAMLYRNASKHVEGYNGGEWEAVGLGVNLYGLRCPCVGSKAVEFRLVNANNYSDNTTDGISAGVALTILTLNQLLWKLHETPGGNVLGAKVSKLWEKVQNASRSKKNGLDVPSILSFCD